MTKEKYKRISVSVQEKKHEKYKEQADKQGLSLSAAIRMALAKFFGKADK